MDGPASGDDEPDPKTTRRGRHPLTPSLALLCAVCAGGEPQGAAAEPPTPRPNLVYIIGDDHGYGDFGFMGSSVARTPNLDRLAAEGTVFRYGFNTASVCKPSLRSLLTGLHEFEFRERERWIRVQGGGLSSAVDLRSFHTLPRQLREVGYASYQAGKYWFGPYTHAGFSGGMATYAADGRVSAAAGNSLVRETVAPVHEFLDAVGDRPFLLWFAPKLPHVPFDAPPEFARLYAEADLGDAARGYLANVTRLDAAVGDLVAQLAARGLRRRTLIVYVSDNGWQWQGADPDDPLHDGPRGKASLYELGMRTPIVFNWPGRVAAGKVRDALVSTVDLFPTLLEFAGAPVPPRRQGRSLAPILRGETDSVRDAVYGEMESQRIARNAKSARPGRPARTVGSFVRTRRWYLVHRGGNELYDMSSDPEQKRDVAAENPEVVKDLLGRLRVWRNAGRRAARAPLDAAAD